MSSAYFQTALLLGLASCFLAANPQSVSAFYGSWVGKYLLGFDMVTVMDRELPSLKEKDIVNWHPKWT